MDSITLALLASLMRFVKMLKDQFNLFASAVKLIALNSTQLKIRSL